MISPHIMGLDNDYLADLGKVPEDFLVPGDAIRSIQRGELDPDTPYALTAAFGGANINLDISSQLVDADHVVLSDPNLSTSIDLAGANINIFAEGELIQGDAFVLFVADDVSGAAEAVWNYPEGTTANQWTNQLVAGTGNRIIFGAGFIPGDCNGDGAVDANDLACVSSIPERDIVLGSIPDASRRPGWKRRCGIC